MHCGHLKADLKERVPEAQRKPSPAKDKKPGATKRRPQPSEDTQTKKPTAQNLGQMRQVKTKSYYTEKENWLGR
jgi:hypothetical protein